MSGKSAKEGDGKNAVGKTSEPVRDIISSTYLGMICKRWLGQKKAMFCPYLSYLNEVTSFFKVQ